MLFGSLTKLSIVQMTSIFGDMSLSVSASNIPGASDPETLKPRSLKKKAPKSLPDTSRTKAKKLKMVDDEDDVKENLNGSFLDLFSSPSKWASSIEENPDFAITQAQDVMRHIVERTTIDRLKRISPIGGEDKLVSELAIAWKHELVGAINVCVEKLSLCDVTFLQTKCPNPIPYSVLASIYELKLRNSGRPGIIHKMSVSENKQWCKKCGEVSMISCNDCKDVSKRFWCLLPTCVERYQKVGEIVCSVVKYCDECHLPIQTDMYVGLKSGHCQCTGVCCSRFYIDELSDL